MPVSSGGVSDYVNTTSTAAREVIADNLISGPGVIATFNPSPGTFDYIIDESGNFLTTEAGDLLVTQSAVLLD